MSHGVQLWLGALFISFAPILVKLIAVPPTLLGFYRCFIAALLLFPLAWWQGFRFRDFWRLSRLGWALIGGIGFLFAIDLFVWHRSIIYAGAGMATILGNTQVFYLALIGFAFYGERFHWKTGTAILFAFVGITLLVKPQNEGSSTYWSGVIFGLATGVAYAAFLTLLRKLESLPIKFPTTARLGLASLSASLFLGLGSAWENQFLIPSPRNLAWLVVLALVAQVFGWLLITRNLPKVPVSRVGLILLTQPVGAAIWGALVFGESLGSLQLFGAGITLLGIYLGNTRHH